MIPIDPPTLMDRLRRFLGYTSVEHRCGPPEALRRHNAALWEAWRTTSSRARARRLLEALARVEADLDELEPALADQVIPIRTIRGITRLREVGRSLVLLLEDAVGVDALTDVFGGGPSGSRTGTRRENSRPATSEPGATQSTEPSWWPPAG